MFLNIMKIGVINIAKEHSFDIVSKVDLQILKDALNVTEKIIKGRFDLKGGTNTIELNEKENTITITAMSDMSLRSLKEILVQNAIKKDIASSAFDFKEPEKAFSGHLWVTAALVQGIDKDNARLITNIIKDSNLKVKSNIQDEQIRVVSKDIDTLQQTMNLLRSDEKITIPLQFSNFR